MPIARTYTSSERTRRAWLVARGAKQAFAGAGTDSYDREIDRIDARAEERYGREASAMVRAVDSARDAVAAAKTAERLADRDGKQAARQAVKEAEQKLRTAEREARKLGL